MTGSTSAEVHRNTDLAARIIARFICPRGHEFTVPFAAHAILPESWVCRQHSIEGCHRTGATLNLTAAAKAKPARTHLMILHERRSQAELENLLADTLAAIRRLGGIRPGCVTIGGRLYSFRYDI